MVVDPIGAAATVTNSKGIMSGLDFLQLFSAEMQNQNPLEPMSNSEMMSQVAQMTNVQMIADLSSSLKSLMDQNQLLQASGLVGKTVSYADAAGQLLTDLVKAVQVNLDGSLSLGLDGGSTISLGSVRQVM
jgi:flagellar basal-body rod modification protein FlgD